MHVCRRPFVVLIKELDVPYLEDGSALPTEQPPRSLTDIAFGLLGGGRRRGRTRPNASSPTTLAFGWLDAAHDYPTGSCPPGVVEGLEDALRTPIDRTRGWQHCTLCPPTAECPTPYTMQDGQTTVLGDASVEVVVDAERRWVAPTLVLHYVRDHGYLPPSEVIDTLASG